MSQTDPAPSASHATTESVLETILIDIVRGTYPPGARLPAERELSRMLGASRPTLREALRTLAEWRLVEPRRGSGVVVLNRNEWSIEVLPAYLRYATPSPGEASIPQILLDLLNMRRALIKDMVKVVADRFPPGASKKPREAAAKAWASRHSIRDFVLADFAVMRAVVEGANFLPAVWMLNRLSGVYIDIASSLTGSMHPPEFYIEAHEQFLDALERGDALAAVTMIDSYLGEHDKRVIAMLGGLDK